MLHIISLTPDEQLLIDPTNRGKQFLKSLVDGPYTPQLTISCKFSRSEWLTRYCELHAKWRDDKHRIALEWDDLHNCKYGPQGGHFSLNVLKDSYIRSYRNAEYRPTFKLALVGLHHLIRIIRERRDRFGMPQPYLKTVIGTSGALPSMLPKGEFITEAFCAKTHRHVYPNLPGERRQRGKERCINQDSNLNVRYIERWMGAIRNWLKTYIPEYFSAWRNPADYLQPRLTSMLNRRFKSHEIDFTACDEHTSLEEVCEVVLPVLEELSIPAEFNYCAAFIEELFYQPIYFGDELWTGKHNLLSGQVITNDCETIYDVCVQVGALIASDLLSSNYVMFSLGDDQTTVISGISNRQSDNFFNYLIDEMTMNGHDINLQKSGVFDNTARFCRKLYYASGPKDNNGCLGSYPLSLVCNAVINPERMIRDSSEMYKATLQRLDTAYGHYRFTPFIQFMGSNLNWEGFDADGVDRARSYDWWERVYNESWSLSHSPSYKVLRDSKIL